MDFDYNLPIYLQVARSIKVQVVSGRIRPGEKLPSNLELAMEYKINPNTVQRVYRELEAQGVTFTRRGIGTFVTEDGAIVDRLKKEMSSELIGAFLREMKALGFSTKEVMDALNTAQT